MSLFDLLLGIRHRSINSKTFINSVFGYIMDKKKLSHNETVGDVHIKANIFLDYNDRFMVVYIANNSFAVVTCGDDFYNRCMYNVLNYGDMLSDGSIITKDFIIEHDFTGVHKLFDGKHRPDTITFNDFLPKMTKSAHISDTQDQ